MIPCTYTHFYGWRQPYVFTALKAGEICRLPRFVGISSPPCEIDARSSRHLARTDWALDLYLTVFLSSVLLCLSLFNRFRLIANLNRQRVRPPQ